MPDDDSIRLRNELAAIMGRWVGERIQHHPTTAAIDAAVACAATTAIALAILPPGPRAQCLARILEELPRLAEARASEMRRGVLDHAIPLGPAYDA